MENLPVEILEIVFQPLSKKEDIENCFNVNLIWRHIIENMFENKSMHHISIPYIFLIRKNIYSNQEHYVKKISAIGVSFTTLEEIQKCFNLGATWQKIIRHQFENKCMYLSSISLLFGLHSSRVACNLTFSFTIFQS